MKDQVGSGQTAPEFLKTLDKQMKNVIIQDATISRDDICDPRAIKEMGTEQMHSASARAIEEISSIMIGINSQITDQGIYFKSQKAHAMFCFEKALGVFEEVVERHTRDN